MTALDLRRGGPIGGPRQPGLGLEAAGRTVVMCFVGRQLAVGPLDGMLLRPDRPLWCCFWPCLSTL
jgi:hypothetical protein